MIPAEAVEAAAARLLYRLEGKSPLEATESEKAMFMDDARAALEAAAPYILSAAYAAGWDDCHKSIMSKSWWAV